MGSGSDDECQEAADEIERAALLGIEYALGPRFGCVLCGKSDLSLDEANTLEETCTNLECRLGMT